MIPLIVMLCICAVFVGDLVRDFYKGNPGRGLK